MRSVIVNAVGSLQRGLLSNYFHRIHNNDANVTKSTLNTVGKSFLLNARVDVPKQKSLDFFKPSCLEMNNFCVTSKLNDKNGLCLVDKKDCHVNSPIHVVVDESTTFPFIGYSSLEIQTNCADHSGIIANHLGILENSGAYITNFSSECEGAPHTSTPVFSLVMKAAIRHDAEISHVIEQLRNSNSGNVTTIILDNNVIEEFSGFGY